jgi:hypothetical protein
VGDLLRQGSHWLEQQRTAHCSSQVTYRRDATELIVAATFGHTRYEVADESGLTVGAQVADFLIAAEDLGPTFSEPQPGDVIVADGQQYEVMALGQDLRGWRWSDPYRQTYRIHGRQIGTEPVGAEP